MLVSITLVHTGTFACQVLHIIQLCTPLVVSPPLRSVKHYQSGKRCHDWSEIRWEWSKIAMPFWVYLVLVGHSRHVPSIS